MSEAQRMRKHKFSVYLLDEEVEILNAKCERYHKTKADFIREVILFGGVKDRMHLNIVEVRELLKQICAIGNSINQIAYISNIECQVTEENFQKLVVIYQELLDACFDFVYRGGKANK